MAAGDTDVPMNGHLATEEQEEEEGKNSLLRWGNCGSQSQMDPVTVPGSGYNPKVPIR